MKSYPGVSSDRIEVFIPIWIFNFQMTVASDQFCDYCLENKSDLVSKVLKEHPDDALSFAKSGRPALMWACLGGSVSIVKQLLQAGTMISSFQILFVEVYQVHFSRVAVRILVGGKRRCKIF